VKALAPAEINPLVPGFLADPFAAYRRLHQAGPVLWHPKLRLWLVAGHAAARQVVRNPVFLSAPAGPIVATLAARAGYVFPMLARSLGVVPFVLNPPAHPPVRRFAASILTGKPLAGYEPVMRALAVRLLGEARAAGGFDAAADFADRLPTLFMGHLLGVPEEEMPGLRRYTDDIAKLFNQLLHVREYRELDGRLGGGLELLERIAAERRRAPRDDAISRMVAARPEGGALSDAEIAAYCLMTFLVGSETTAALIGGAVRILLESPAHYAELRGERALLKPAVEEFLRCETPVQLLSRFASADAEAGGQRIAHGERMVVLLGAANRDPAAYPEPDRFDPRRDGAAHLAFGEAAHACIGATLARTEVRVALDAFLDLPPLRLRAPGRYGSYDWLRRLRQLPVEFA